MKNLALVITVLALVGCNDGENSSTNKKNSQPKEQSSVPKNKIDTLTMSSGDRIELYDNGTWSRIKDDDRQLKNNEILNIAGKNGDDKDVQVKTMIQIKDENNRYALKSNADRLISFASMMIGNDLKNKYSFVPREALIIFEKDGVAQIMLSYTSKNSYGADIADNTLIKYDLIHDLVINK